MRLRAILALAALLALPGCMHSYRVASGTTDTTPSASVHRSAARSEIAFSGLPLEEVADAGERDEREARRVVSEERLAEAETASDPAIEVRTDASSAPLMVYTAQFHVGVYRVVEAQASIAALAAELGGFVTSQTDDTIVVRVPVARFFEAVDRIGGTGDVLHRDVRATDVSEEFRDNDIRLANLEAMRVRLEELLRRATAVEDALRIERELERVTVELELLRGRQRFLSDRIALSTLAVSFRVLPHEALDQPDTFNLPFAFLRELGLASLLRME